MLSGAIKFFITLLVVVSVVYANSLYSNSSSCSYEATCTVNGYDGACVSISSGCCSTGVTTSGLCPGSSDIKCCTQNQCATPAGSGTCMQTSLCSSKGGASVSGYCTGPSDVQCCVTGGTATVEYGVDVCVTITSSVASCLKSSGITFVIPRGYRSTGSIDTQVCTSLINAYNGGIKTRDVYIFPCPTCSKTAEYQMNELISYLNANCKAQWSGRIWLDIEGSEYWFSSSSSNQAWYKVR
jgi:hypothetical protein